MRLYEHDRGLVRALVARLMEEPVQVVIATFAVSFLVLLRKYGFTHGAILESANKGIPLVTALCTEHEQERRRKPQTYH